MSTSPWARSSLWFSYARLRHSHVHLTMGDPRALFALFGDHEGAGDAGPGMARVEPGDCVAALRLPAIVNSDLSRPRCSGEVR